MWMKERLFSSYDRWTSDGPDLKGTHTKICVASTGQSVPSEARPWTPLVESTVQGYMGNGSPMASKLNRWGGADQSDHVGKIKKGGGPRWKLLLTHEIFVGSVSDIDRSPLAQLNEMGAFELVTLPHIKYGCVCTNYFHIRASNCLYEHPILLGNRK